MTGRATAISPVERPIRRERKSPMSVAVIAGRPEHEILAHAPALVEKVRHALVGDVVAQLQTATQGHPDTTALLLIQLLHPRLRPERDLATGAFGAIECFDHGRVPAFAF